jgi:gliding motility-associated-like protein
VEYFDPPIAVNDTTRTLRDTPVVIDIKSNDTIYGGIFGTPYILDAPLYGDAQFNLDCSVTYTPDEQYCERTDMFTYVICNPNGCDTATVFVFIECVGVVVFNAVSPNKDGFNDTFYVFGLDDKPDNMLEIYNRWGNRVYKTTNYQNDWAGTWDNNKDLPDGTYFYILEYLDEEGNTVKLNGYLELYR